MQNKTKKYMYDLSFAFDLADHKILIPKLKVYGFDSNTLPHFRLLIYPQEKSVLIFEIPHSEIGADYEISEVQKAWPTWEKEAVTSRLLILKVATDFGN